jgi:hypothetical protein
MAHQAQQIRRQQRQRRFGHRILWMHHEVPSCGYLLPVAADHLSQSPADAVAHDGPSQCFFDTETEAAQWQLIGAQEDGEVRTGSAFPGTIDSIKFAASHQPRLARKLLSVLHRDCSRCLFPKLGREGMTALLAARRKHFAATLGFHTRTEPVSLGAATLPRLKCTLWQNNSPL